MTRYLRIDPGVPIAWSAPELLRFGADRARLELRNPSVRAQRLIAGLRTGLEERHLPNLQLLFGISPAESAPLLSTLEPVLVREDRDGSAPAVPPLIAVSPPPGPSRPDTSRLLSRVLRGGGGRVAELAPGQLLSRPGPAPGPGAETGAADPVTVLIGRYAIAPARGAALLRLGLPHAPVVFSDTEVRVGPLVTAVGDPCLFCLECHRRDAEPAWPALASQLYDRPSPRETPVLASLAAAEVLALLDRWRDGDERVHWERLVLRVPDAGTSPGGAALPVARRERVRAHVRCGCAALPSALPGHYPGPDAEPETGTETETGTAQAAEPAPPAGAGSPSSPRKREGPRADPRRA
ncbi:hypothetical protein [Leucobacter sp. M11]|uniref:hypothetical protein n=1 Tax=Leucobacter sp. M11 TaxID=2993565 RepID=UPI002D810CCF|nr:hypothetical protein [Leucobacter sp. M11]MEB4615979.1 hypothetical protein [Leucobacter sp. M11]